MVTVLWVSVTPLTALVMWATIISTPSSWAQVETEQLAITTLPPGPPNPRAVASGSRAVAVSGTEPNTEPSQFLGWLFWRAGHAPVWPEFPLYHTLSNLSIGNLHKNQYRNSPIIVQHYQLTNRPICDILLVSRGDREHLFQAGLGTVCGGREKSAETLGKSQSSKKM